jgi:putative phosphoesterase
VVVHIGIVSDIHSNAVGLAGALARMGDVDQLLCAGDLVEEFRFDNEVIELLRDHDARCVQGNHDMGLLSAHGARARAAAHVNPELVQYLAELPTRLELHIGGKTLLMVHASPFAPFNEYVWRHSPALKRFREIEADYVVLGHTHAQMVERVGRALVINPGSAGQARDHTNGKQLSYAVLDTSTDQVVIDNYLPAPLPAGSAPGTMNRSST